MIFVYLVPSGFFIFEFVALLLLGGGLFTAAMDPQTATTIQCGCWSIAAMSIVTIIYLCVNFHKQVKRDRFLDISKMFPGIFAIHMGGGSAVFIIFSLLLGGAKGGVFSEIFWFLELCGYILAIAVYSFVFCGIAVVVLMIPCMWINRKMRKEDEARNERIRQYKLQQEIQKQQDPVKQEEVPPVQKQTEKIPAGKRVIPLAELLNVENDNS